MSSMEYKETHLQDIEDINKCFSNRKLLKKCIYRFILQGNNSDEAIDGIIYGVSLILFLLIVRRPLA